MNITILFIEALIFAALFTVLVFVNYRGEKKYSAAAIHNYPPDIQEEYFKTHQRVDVSSCWTRPVPAWTWRMRQPFRKHSPG